MKNEHANGAAPDPSQKEVNELGGVLQLLTRIEEHLAQENRFSRAIVGKLSSIDESLDLLAAQKRRELDADSEARPAE